MRISQFFTLIVFVFLFNGKSYAMECANLVGVDSVVDCLIEKHPQLSLAQINVDIAAGEINRASQRVNPKLEWEGTEAQRGSGFSQEFNLKHTIELGSKQSARVKLAEAGKDVQTAGLEKEYNDLKVHLILLFYRYRQILHEMEIVEENKNTFAKMISQYQQIGRLNPEQEVSLNVFTMTMEEVRLKLHHLENERDEILAHFEVILEKRFIPTKKQLPKVDHNWPPLKSGKLEGALVKQGEARLIEAQKLYDLEKAKSWPNLAVGPRIQTIPGPQGGTFLGAAVSLPLPILSLNGGGREKALAQQKRREIEKKLIDRKIKIESRRLASTYERSIRSHSRAIKSSTILKKHKKLHRMIDRGVVSPVMVIELHREIIEFYESLHEHELDAVKTRWQYYSLHGKLDKEKIQLSGGH